MLFSVIVSEVKFLHLKIVKQETGFGDASSKIVWCPIKESSEYLSERFWRNLDQETLSWVPCSSPDKQSWENVIQRKKKKKKNRKSYHLFHAYLVTVYCSMCFIPHLSLSKYTAWVLYSPHFTDESVEAQKARNMPWITKLIVTCRDMGLQLSI